jgi:hypothetical protein
VTPYQPELPGTAHLAVTTGERDFNRFAAANSQLVIVLDYSGSMRTPTRSSGGKRTRKQEALEALRKGLGKVPEGVKVTILTFGQAEDNQAIEPRWGPNKWDPSSESVDEVIAKLSLLTPKGTTPLVRSIAKAKEYFTPGFTGAKTILVVTDGGDNDFNDPAYGADLRKKGDTMAKFLRNEFDDKSNIQIVVLGFTVNELKDLYEAEKDPDEKRRLKKELEGLEEFGPAVEKVGGTFLTVSDSDKLATQLQRFLLQIRYRVEGKENNVDSGTVPPKVIGEDGASVYPNRGNYGWLHGLEPGSFLVTLQTNLKQKKAVEQRVRLKGGDAMALQLQPDPKTGQFVLRPEVWGRSYDIKERNRLIEQRTYPPEADVPSWLVSVVQNQRTNNGQQVRPLHIMTAIEKVDRSDANATRETGLGMGRPAFVWFDVSAKGAAGKPAGGGRRFYPLPDYPAPAYALDLAEWRRDPQSGLDQEPVLDVYWTEDAPPSCGVLRAENGKRLTDTDYEHHRLEVKTLNQNDPSWLFVESIRHERRKDVEVKPGEKRPDPMDCVVVRLSWDPDAAKGKAFFAQLPENYATGWEQRIYLEAGKSTGVFYNVSEERLKALDHLTLYSVEGVKAKANKLPGLQLGSPNDRPRPARITDNK